MSEKVQILYNSNNVAEVEGGKTATLPVAGMKMQTNIDVIVPKTEVIPEYSNVAGFKVSASEYDEGTLELDYTTPRDVKLSAPSGSASAVRFVSLSDDNFVPWNIKKGVTIFGMPGSFEEPIWDPTNNEQHEVKIENTLPTFNFSINGRNDYVAEEGMTWYEWCLSNFNATKATCAGEGDGHEVYIGNEKVCTSDGPVSGGQTITAGGSYTTKA